MINMKSILFTLALLVTASMVVADDFDLMKARYVTEQDIDRKAGILVAINSPTTTHVPQVVTNTAPAYVFSAVQNLFALATNLTPIISQTGLDYSAIRGYGIAHAAELTDLQVITLYRMDSVWQTVKDSPHLAEGLTRFKAILVSTNLVAVPAASIAEQRLGRFASIQDLEP